MKKVIDSTGMINFTSTQLRDSVSLLLTVWWCAVLYWCAKLCAHLNQYIQHINAFQYRETQYCLFPISHPRNFITHWYLISEELVCITLYFQCCFFLFLFFKWTKIAHWAHKANKIMQPKQNKNIYFAFFLFDPPHFLGVKKFFIYINNINMNGCKVLFVLMHRQ